ncbi:unnamed protein product [Closterium sp. Naga37s-1]|nr:unnamed protein product [Closterium sp. Naga37s-1]
MGGRPHGRQRSLVSHSGGLTAGLSPGLAARSGLTGSTFASSSAFAGGGAFGGGGAFAGGGAAGGASGSGVGYVSGSINAHAVNSSSSSSFIRGRRRTISTVTVTTAVAGAGGEGLGGGGGGFGGGAGGGGVVSAQPPALSPRALAQLDRSFGSDESMSSSGEVVNVLHDASGGGAGSMKDESRARDTSGAAQRDMCRILRARCSYRCGPLFQDTHRTPLVELAVARAEDQEEEDEEEGEEVEEGWKEEGRMWEEGAEGEWYDEQHGQEEGEYGAHSSGHDSFAVALAAAGGWDSGAQGSSRQVSGRQGGASHGVSPPVSGAMESGRQGGEGRRRKAEVARERKRKKAPPPLALERQKNRLAATKCITAALQQAEVGSLAAAQRTIQQGVAAIQASYAMQQGDEASMHLINELMEIERRMCNMQTYKGAGLAYALSAQSAHLLQRANTRGGGAAADSTAGLDYMRFSPSDAFNGGGAAAAGVAAAAASSSKSPSQPFFDGRQGANGANGMLAAAAAALPQPPLDGGGTYSNSCSSQNGGDLSFGNSCEQLQQFETEDLSFGSASFQSRPVAACQTHQQQQQQQQQQGGVGLRRQRSGVQRSSKPTPLVVRSGMGLAAAVAAAAAAAGDGRLDSSASLSAVAHALSSSPRPVEA